MRAVYGEDTPAQHPVRGRARKHYAAVIAKREPWGLKLRRFQNPNFAMINTLPVRRVRSGGPWHLKYGSVFFAAEDLEELFLQVVEHIDNLRPDWRPMITHYYKLPGYEQKRNKGGTGPSSDESGGYGNLRYLPGSGGRYLPSEMFFKQKP